MSNIVLYREVKIQVIEDLKMFLDNDIEVKLYHKGVNGYRIGDLIKVRYDDCFSNGWVDDSYYFDCFILDFDSDVGCLLYPKNRDNMFGVSINPILSNMGLNAKLPKNGAIYAQWDDKELVAVTEQKEGSFFSVRIPKLFKIPFSTKKRIAFLSKYFSNQMKIINENMDQWTKNKKLLQS